MPLGKLIRWYRETFERVSNWRRTKTQHLRFLENHPLAAINVRELTTQSLIAHVRDRRTSGAGPATVSCDLTWLGVVLRAAKSVLNETVNPDIVDEARRACRELRLIGRSRKRTRRPTVAELDQLDVHFSQQRHARIPMRDIVQFAVASARREAESLPITEWCNSRCAIALELKH